MIKPGVGKDGGHMTNDDVREEQAATFTRPELLRRAGAVAVSLGLGSAFAPQAFAAPEAGGDIKMLTWQGYDVQKAMKPFQKAHDLSFHATFIGNHDDIQAKVTQDPSGYNLITYYEGYHELYKQLNILSPIDPAKVPNLKKNYSQFKNKNWWVSDGKLWGVPWTWGSWTLNYNPAKMAAPTKWTDLLDPKFKGKIAILDDPNGAIVIGARILKLPIPNLTSKQLDQVIALWRKFRANARTISPSPGDLVNLFAERRDRGSGARVHRCHGARGVAESQAHAGHPVRRRRLVRRWWAIPPQGPDRDGVLEWINQTLTPKVQAYQSESLLQGVVQPSALPALSSFSRKLFPYANLDKWFKSAPLLTICRASAPALSRTASG